MQGSRLWDLSQEISLYSSILDQVARQWTEQTLSSDTLQSWAREILFAQIEQDLSQWLSYRQKQKTLDETIDKVIDQMANALISHMANGADAYAYYRDDIFELITDEITTPRDIAWGQLQELVPNPYWAVHVHFRGEFAIFRDLGFDVRHRLFELMDLDGGRLEALTDQIFIGDLDATNAYLDLDPYEGRFEIHYRE